MVIKKGNIPWNKGLPKELQNRYGTHHSEEVKKKISKSHLGIRHTNETKEKLRLLNLNRKHSEETKLKISIANKGKIHSKEHNKKVSEAISGEKNYMFGNGYLRKGDKNPMWRGGITDNPYDNAFNKSFKNMIRKRDNQICMNCGIHREKLSRALSVHHIDYNKELTIKENCISLCMSCHTITGVNREYWKKLFQDKLNKLYNYQYENGNIILNVNKFKMEEEKKTVEELKND